jgi:hypothetical protein
MGDFERGLIQGEAMRHHIEKTNIELLAENTKLKAALRCFLEDDRFHVAVGGNPNVVDRMLAEARALLTE